MLTKGLKESWRYSSDGETRGCSRRRPQERHNKRHVLTSPRFNFVLFEFIDLNLKTTKKKVWQLNWRSAASTWRTMDSRWQSIKSVNVHVLAKNRSKHTFGSRQGGTERIQGANVNHCMASQSKEYYGAFHKHKNLCATCVSWLLGRPSRVAKTSCLEKTSPPYKKIDCSGERQVDTTKAVCWYSSAEVTYFSDVSVSLVTMVTGFLCFIIKIFSVCIMIHFWFNTWAKQANCLASFPDCTENVPNCDFFGVPLHLYKICICSRTSGDL